MLSWRIKYLGISLTKEMQNVYFENYNILLKKIKDLDKWNTLYVHGLTDLILLRCISQIYRFNTIL